MVASSSSAFAESILRSMLGRPVCENIDRMSSSENPAAWTLSYGLQSFKSAHHTNWNLTMAATVMVMAPVILLFFLAQKAFIEGVTLTGVKG